MEQGCTSRFTALIDQLLVEDLSPRKMGELRGHLATCPACQHRYNRVVLASRLLEGGPESLRDASLKMVYSCNVCSLCAAVCFAGW